MGLGHVKRCVSLAEALLDLGAHVRLISRDLGFDIRQLALPEGLVIEMLPRPGNRSAYTVDVHDHMSRAGVLWAEDADQTLSLLAGQNVDWLVVDHYSFDRRWHRRLKDQAGLALAAIDDLGDRYLDVDLLIDHNYSIDHRVKYAGRIASSTKILGGPRFALIARAYADAKPYWYRRSVQSIGVFMGGSDQGNWSSAAVRACREIAQFEGRIEVATTSANPNLADLELLCSRWHDTILSVDLPNLADFFGRHDLQVGAGGGATWERCCLGAPTISVICAENQRGVVDALDRLGVVKGIHPPATDLLSLLGQNIRELIADAEARWQLATRSREMVDAQGARRVAYYMCKGHLMLRDASEADAMLLYEWRNNPATRAVSLRSDEIDWQAHLKWFSEVLSDPTRLLQIGMIGSHAVGVIRFDGIGGETAEVSLYLDPAYHGIGIGPRLLEAGERKVRARAPNLETIVARVLASNAASRRMFQSAGYTHRSNGCFIKTLSFH